MSKSQRFAKYFKLVRWARARYSRDETAILSIHAGTGRYNLIERAAWHRYMHKGGTGARTCPPRYLEQ